MILFLQKFVPYLQIFTNLFSPLPDEKIVDLFKQMAKLLTQEMGIWLRKSRKHSGKRRKPFSPFSTMFSKGLLSGLCGHDILL